MTATEILLDAIEQALALSNVACVTAADQRSLDEARSRLRHARVDAMFADRGLRRRTMFVELPWPDDTGDARPLGSETVDRLGE